MHQKDPEFLFGSVKKARLRRRVSVRAIHAASPGEGCGVTRERLTQLPRIGGRGTGSSVTSPEQLGIHKAAIMIPPRTLASVQEQAVELLVTTGRVSAVAIEAARAAARSDRDGRGVGYHLVELNLTSTTELRSALEKVSGLATIALADYPLTADAARLTQVETARTHRAIPFSLHGRTVHLALDDPFNLDASSQLRARTGLDVQTHLADEHSLWKRIAELSDDFEPDRAGDVGEVAQQAASEIEQLQARTGRGSRLVEDVVERSWIPQLLDRVMREGVQRGASDIHVEFFRTGGRVRYRIDGALVEWDQRLDPRLQEDLIARVKVISDLDSTNRRRPQDGRTMLRIGAREVEFRVSTLPTVRGEKAVLRVLDHAAQPLDIGKLGLDGADERCLRHTVLRSHGMVLVTGPTGSGKSTTLYSILQHLNHPAANIITVEDPVEREIPGITQVPVRPSPDAELDLSYAAVLRAMLRQDPNILMVGEIRDPETARIAVRAAITGHLVLSTVHTNDAPGTMTRLLDMGIEPYNIIGALRLVVAQRLVRRICPHCREPEEPSDEQLAMAETRRPQVAGIRFFRGRGCAHCNHTGYRGRIGLFEVMQITDRIRPLILSRKTEAEIRAAALSGQMIPLRSVGWARIREGKTTLEEVLRET